MRVLLMLLGALGAVASGVFGFLFVVVGWAEQHHIDSAYVVGFVPGADCGDGHELYLRVEDGAIVQCVQGGPGVFGSGAASLHGFTDTQNQELTRLAAELGSDGLSAAEQREIQQNVDEAAATVAPTNRPYGDQAVSGAHRMWLGAGMIVIGIAVVVAIYRWS
ncbi:hypothetical protein L3Q67_45450 (plasmid) [Saccharothrix sp. AJ9571]|nr:hypothetical protein L3Q67_45450 [Saccharothrix sp. AJ9571]